MMMTQPFDTPETVDSKSVLTRSDTFPTPVWKINVPGFKAIVQELEWDLTQVAPRVISCWAMINPQHAHNAFLHHPNSVLSCVYYVQTPERGNTSPVPVKEGYFLTT